MNKKSKLWVSALGAGANDTQSLAAIAAGDVWVITEFGAADINKGDNLSSLYILKWNGTILDGGIISATGCTVSLNRNWEITDGDGIKQLTVERYNTSGSLKQMPVWLIGYKRS